MAALRQPARRRTFKLLHQPKINLEWLQAAALARDIRKVHAAAQVFSSLFTGDTPQRALGAEAPKVNYVRVILRKGHYLLCVVPTYERIALPWPCTSSGVGNWATQRKLSSTATPRDNGEGLSCSRMSGTASSCAAASPQSVASNALIVMPVARRWPTCGRSG